MPQDENECKSKEGRRAGPATPIDRPPSREEQLAKQLALAEMSNLALKQKLKQVSKVSASRLKRMNQRGKLLFEARATIMRLQKEAHGG